MTNSGYTPINIHEAEKRLRRLLSYRALTSTGILFAVGYLFYAPFSELQRQLFIAATFSFAIFIVLEWYLIRSKLPFPIQLFIQFGLDMFLVAILILLTDGIQSPFVFLFGLIIVAAGTQAHTLVVLLLTVVGCVCYLLSIYGFALWSHLPISASEMLHVQLQTSALFLVGGVMAAITRRHASLQRESHQVVRQHRRLQELHEQVVSSMQEGIIILDDGLHIQDSNERAHHLLAIDRNLRWLELSSVQRVPDELLTFLHRAESESFQCEWATASGFSIVSVTSLPDHDPAARWLLTLTDISHVRRLEKTLAEQDKLAAMGRMLAMLAHEIRNPLQTIGQSVELIREVKGEKQQDIQRIVGEEVDRLNRLVAKMLDYVQPLTPDPVTVACSDLIGSSVVQVDMQGEMGITWQCDIDSLLIDPDHFRLVLDNLLRNAVQASREPDSVMVIMSQKDGAWELSIMDQGGGISEEMKECLFEPFSTGRRSGIGLGLATVWQVCQINGWHVQAKDITDGALFTVRGETVEEGVIKDG